VAYNGGKDCCLMTHMLLLCLADLHVPPATVPAIVRGFDRGVRSFVSSTRLDNFIASILVILTTCLLLQYFHFEGSFEEVTDFARTSAVRLGFQLIETSRGYKAGLQDLIDGKLSTADRSSEPANASSPAPSVAAVLMGTRRTDPGASQLQPMAPTDPGWPPLMRVNPLLDWSYHQVWAALRAWAVDVCPLYARGYSSIGLVKDTSPHPELIRRSEDGSTTALAPEALSDASAERGGRTRGGRL
jgi:3'-phosphoadenosine 5'-phosphosulfate sulfotransferase (PAPS reductase)/FAD synthetase